jgi:ADP-heptose:LPS heptosyltransferase
VPPIAPAVSGVTVVHPGAAFGARRWPAERFAAVATELTRRGEEVVITGSAAERELAARVASQAGLPSAAVLAGRTDVLQLAAVVAAARLVVTGDTGTAHLASAFRTPSVVLFGPTPPAWWGPPPGPPRRVVARRGARRSLGRASRSALLRIGAHEVLAPWLPPSHRGDDLRMSSPSTRPAPS